MMIGTRLNLVYESMIQKNIKVVSLIDSEPCSLIGQKTVGKPRTSKMWEVLS